MGPEQLSNGLRGEARGPSDGHETRKKKKASPIQVIFYWENTSGSPCADAAFPLTGESTTRGDSPPQHLGF